MKLAHQPVRRNLRAKPAPLMSIFARCARERQSPDCRSLPSSYAPRGASIPFALTRLRILPVTTGVCTPSLLSILNSVSPCLPRLGRDPIWKHRRRNRSSTSPFRINTCKSVSKQRTLTTFRMNTYEKRGEGGKAQPTESAQSGVRQGCRCRRVFATRSGRPRPSVPKTAGSITPVIAVAYWDKEDFPGSARAQPKGCFSGPAPGPFSAAAFPAESQSCVAPYSLPRPATDPTSRSALPAPPACFPFAPYRDQNSGTAPPAPQQLPFCAAALADRPKGSRYQGRTSAKAFPPSHPES